VSQSGQRLRLELLGSADETGSAAVNVELSKLRAQTVLVALGEEPLGAFTAVTTGILPSVDKRGVSTAYAAQRIVTLRASVEAIDNKPETARP
jgi:hypothetical protein